MGKKYLITIFVISFCLSLAIPSFGQKKQKQTSCEEWVNKTMSTLTLEEKIAQLVVARVPKAMTPKVKDAFLENITKYKVGGLCFFAGKCDNQLSQTKEYQELSEVPLLICIDGEWGLGMRLTDAYSFPRQMMMGAITNDTLIYKMVKEIALQCKKMGIHVNFAPCIDVNSNPLNPVIGSRSFGENPKRVAQKSLQYMYGLQKNDVVAVAKHFPGHGNTDVDSHLDLPTLKQSKKELTNVDLYPYKVLIQKGIQGVMVAHLQVDAYDDRTNRPSSLSKNIVTDLLCKDMNFSGLVITDGLDMKAITKNFKNGNAELEAILAGVDILLLPEDIPAAIETIKTAAENDENLAKIIDTKCRKMLKIKYKTGAFNQDLKKLSTPDTNDWNRCEAIAQEISDNAITMVKNQNATIPLKLKKNQNIVSVNIGCSKENTFTKTLDQYTHCRHLFVPENDDFEQYPFADSLTADDVVILTIYGKANPTAKKNYGISNNALSIADSVLKYSNTVIINFLGSPYGVKNLEKITSAKAILVGYQNLACSQRSSAEAIVGAISIKGRIPVSSGSVKEGFGLKTKKIRKKYNEEQSRYSRKQFATVDSIANKGIKQKAYPGCQILVAQDGEIVFNQCYGHFTYDKNSPLVNDNTMYDVASLTKVSATTFAVMKLIDAGKIKLTDRLSKYLPYLKHTNKSKITIIEALSHIARLQAFIPFWEETIHKGKLDDDIYAINPKDKSDYSHLAGDIYVKKSYRDEILKKIAKSDRIPKKKYLYSDFGFILLADMVEHVSGQSLDIFMQQNFYEPLEMNRTSFNPLQHGFSKDNIAPTENDTHFRNSQLQGTVHDETAALMGGVSGHAGLFSTASDLAKLFQLLINKGVYKNKTYISQETIETFNQRHFIEFGNRRALGFDKPLINEPSSHCSPEASQQSFGHSGFTGTFVWVDPEYNLVYIFLSNRVYPNTKPNKLASLNIRTNIQTEIYKIIKSEKIEKNED